MLTYSFSDRNKESLYNYLYKCIKDDIISGVLSPHEKLPSKRAFASNHGISIITVENAYEQLMAEGYIYSKPKSGFYVSPIDTQISSTHSSASNLKSNSQLDSVKINTSDNEKFNLITNHTSIDSFPFSTWAKITRRIISGQDTNLLTPPPSGGVMELREAISKHLYDFRAISCNPEQIIIGAGTEYLYSLIVQLFGQDHIYGVENPGSRKIRNIYESLGATVVPLSMDDEGILLSEDNLSAPDIIHISPSHNFPTGVVTSIGRRYGLLHWANKSENRFIIEDDYDSEFRLQGKPISSLFSIDSTDRVIYFNTFTKSLAPTIRISYMVLPKSLLNIFYQKLGFYSCTVSNFEQYTLASFIRENHFEKHINRMRNFYRNLRDELLNSLYDSELKKHITISGENAGLHFLMHIHSNCDDAFLKEKASENNLIVAFLSDYFYHDGSMPDVYEHTAIINYSALSIDNVAQIVDALENAWLPYVTGDI